jgi:hypothetical protein
MTHHSAGEEEPIMLLCGVQIGTTDPAAFDRYDYLPLRGGWVIDVLNGERGARFVKYRCAHNDVL